MLPLATSRANARGKLRSGVDFVGCDLIEFRAGIRAERERIDASGGRSGRVDSGGKLVGIIIQLCGSNKCR
jgi:hypothetical protein